MRRIARQLSSSTMGMRTSVTRGNLKRTKSSDDAFMTMLGSKKVIFTVTYCCNCDGGDQEYSAVAECIRDVFPGCEIIENKIDTFPITVTLTSEVIEGEDDDDETIPTVLWTAPQQALFRKYPADRTKSIRDIKAKLKEYIMDLAGDE